MLVAAAFCPAAPVLHPAVSAGAAGETAELRGACVDAVTDLAAVGADLIVTVGTAPRTGPYSVGSRGSLHGYGIDVTLGGGDGPVELPASLGLAAWLLELAAPGVESLPFGVAADDVPARCATLGAGLGDRAARVALLVIGDGSACRDVKAPGSYDERAAAFDAKAFDALAQVDLRVLADLDVRLSAELLVGGRAPWQVAAGAAAARRDARGTPLVGTLRHSEAPYGVGYAVVSWRVGG